MLSLVKAFKHIGNNGNTNFRILNSTVGIERITEEQCSGFMEDDKMAQS